MSQYQNPHQEFGEPVIATLERSGLNPNDVVVIGGSAIALAGVRVSGDADLAVRFKTFDSIKANRRTPSGIPLEEQSLDLPGWQPDSDSGTQRLTSMARTSTPLDLDLLRVPDDFSDFKETKGITVYDSRIGPIAAYSLLKLSLDEPKTSEMPTSYGSILVDTPSDNVLL
jgi:hypothetical protein